ncbi:MAG: hypothetical protein Rpha_1773 [Candidatus Ruthia sp. Apha_13_S6]|nr:hypothetical protein [Candidatus Ruthia sp. Apha_13_S6]
MSGASLIPISFLFETVIPAGFYFFIPIFGLGNKYGKLIDS